MKSILQLNAKFIYVVCLVWLLCMLIAASLSAQKPVKMNVSGDYVTTMDSIKSQDKLTGKSFIDSKGVKYPIRESVNKKLYYLKTAKSGNTYRVYLKIK